VHPFVAVAAPVFIIADVLGMVDCNCPYITGCTLLYNVSRHRVQEVSLSSGLLFLRPFSTVAGTVFTFRVVLHLTEVVSVFFHSDKRFQRAGTTTRSAVTTAGDHEFTLHYVKDTTDDPS